MKHLTSGQWLAATAVALAAFTAASSAQARSDVSFSVGVQVPGVYVQSAPVYVLPRPVYTPAPLYERRYDDGRRNEGERWQHRGPHDFREGYVDNFDPRGPWHPVRLYGPNGDLDRDGIVNRRDHDRDGDGVRNRYDRFPDNPYRR
ncbi:hypothetical protein [Rhodoferax sp.]|uniref:hypothetical protein n=1 Tax=Rhodoferax sp. TaxID=50421 RepID=UPI00283C0ED9|nr:hypothetical protein [Rhodoferax sp.]MDR3370099.1 hypothetical protein [Rhodoferax sp.]